MKYIMLIWIFTGENIKIESIGFESYDNCMKAEQWVNREGQKGQWRPNFKPQAECFKI